MSLRSRQRRHSSHSFSATLPRMQVDPYVRESFYVYVRSADGAVAQTGANRGTTPGLRRGRGSELR
jgi:hypothetical protein